MNCEGRVIFFSTKLIRKFFENLSRFIDDQSAKPRISVYDVPNFLWYFTQWKSRRNFLKFFLCKQSILYNYKYQSIKSLLVSFWKNKIEAEILKQRDGNTRFRTLASTFNLIFHFRLFCVSNPQSLKNHFLCLKYLFATLSSTDAHFSDYRRIGFRFCRVFETHIPCTSRVSIRYYPVREGGGGKIFWAPGGKNLNPALN